ncbi:MAG: hypothetical protein WCY10_04960 [Candidatus Omnitrophota bacterium]
MTLKMTGLALGLLFVAFFLNGGSVSAAEAKPKTGAAVKETVKIVAKEASGTVSALSGNFIAVATGVDPVSKVGVESAFNLDKKVRIIHKKSLNDIKTGDTVKVNYEETLKIQEGKRKSRSTKVISITFLKAAPKTPDSQEPAPQVEQPQEEPSAQEGNEASSGSLSLKGLKEE